MVGVRVPFLNPTIWRYAIEDADDGAMLWRDDRGHIVAFNMVHRSGTEGWMGPLAVRTEFQGSGIGKEIVTRGVEWLKRSGRDVSSGWRRCRARWTTSDSIRGWASCRAVSPLRRRSRRRTTTLPRS